MRGNLGVADRRSKAFRFCSGVDLSEPGDALAALAFDEQKSRAQARNSFTGKHPVSTRCVRKRFPGFRFLNSSDACDPEQIASASHSERLQQEEQRLHEVLEACFDG